MATTAELIQSVWRYGQLHKGLNRNKLNGSLTNSTTSVTVEFATGPIKAGAKISVDLEDMHVWSVAALVATVERAQWGSAAATHADDSIVYVNPEASPFETLAAINDELAALSSPANGLFKVATVDLTYNPAVTDYNLTSVTDVIGILEVKADDNDASYNWSVFPRDRWRLKRNSNTTDFASGFALELLDSAYPGGSVRVAYKTSFTALSTLADNVATTSGLPSTALDVLAMGAAIRLTAGRPIRRSALGDQGDTRRSEEVSTTDTLQAPSGLRALYRSRIAEEAARLAAAYPG